MVLAFSFLHERDEGDSGDKACDDYDTELMAFREDLVDSLNAWVVEVTEAEDLRRSFDQTVSKIVQPTVVFFRCGTPVLYFGPADEILAWLGQILLKCI